MEVPRYRRIIKKTFLCMLLFEGFPGSVVWPIKASIQSQEAILEQEPVFLKFFVFF
jgi:hypothetical protein